jgi:lipopolysaccharide transport system permease protein
MTAPPADMATARAAGPSDAPAATVTLVIEPGMTARNYWRDLWRYRELTWFLAWRDIAVRYKQTAIGVAWALIRPALTMLVFVGFRRLVGLPAHAVPDPVFVFAAVLPWQLFSGALADSASSLIGNANLISKIYFPRLIVPAGSVITSFVDFLITLGMMAVLMLWYRFMPDLRLLTLPLFMALAFGASFGIGLWLCALNVEYRDFRYIVPFIVQFGLYISPVGFSSAIVPEKWRLLYALNPMVGVIDGFRWAILGDAFPVNWPGFLLSSVLVVSIFIGGVMYFRRMERSFADVV